MGMIVPKRRRMTQIPHPHAAHLPYLPEPRMSISGSVIFYGGCRFNLLYNIGGGLEKCYIVIHRVVGCSKKYTALYNM